MTGMDTSAVSPALSAKLPALNALMVEVFAQADGMTGKGCSANYFRANVNDSMLMGAAREFLKDKGIGKWDIIAVDYSSGHDAAEKFKALVKSQGGSIGKVLFAPFGTADFGAKISELGADPADGLYVTIFGSDAINLAKQQAQFGLFKKYKMVLGNSFVIPQTLPRRAIRCSASTRRSASFRASRARRPKPSSRLTKEKYNGELPAYTSRRPIYWRSN